MNIVCRILTLERKLRTNRLFIIFLRLKTGNILSQIRLQTLRLNFIKFLIPFRIFLFIPFLTSISIIISISSLYPYNILILILRKILFLIKIAFVFVFIFSHGIRKLVFINTIKLFFNYIIIIRLRGSVSISVFVSDYMRQVLLSFCLGFRIRELVIMLRRRTLRRTITTIRITSMFMLSSML